MTGIMCVLGKAGGGKTISLAGGSTTDLQIIPLEAGCGWSFLSDGGIDKRVGSGTVGNPLVITADTGWYLYEPVSGVGSGYWIKGTLLPGDDTPAGPAMGTWHQLSSSVTWTLNSTTGFKQSRITVAIASAANDAAIINSATYTIYAEASP